VNFQDVLWGKPSNAHLFDGTIKTFKVTHPFHPLCGNVYDLVTYRYNWGIDRAYYHDAKGKLSSIPACWTSIYTPPPFVVVSAGRVPFCFNDLLELSRLIDKISNKKINKKKGEIPSSL
jgi:hypothetical protein